MTTPEQRQRQRLTEIINAGLVSGLGEARPGHLCVEAAICLAMGEPHGADPSCVEKPDRDFSIRINDANWSSPEARAKALLPLALVQLGTAGSDRTAWVRRVVEGTIRRIVPIALRAAASVHPDEGHRAALEGAAIRCEREGTRGAAHAAEDAAYAAYAYATADAAAAYAAEAANAAARAAYAAARAAYAANAANAAAADAAAADDADIAAYATARAIGAARAAYDAADAAAYAYAAAYAAAADAAHDAARAAHDARAVDRDDVLRLAVQIALDAYAAEGRTP